jgi:hypothetical protein
LRAEGRFIGLLSDQQDGKDAEVYGFRTARWEKVRCGAVRCDATQEKIGLFRPWKEMMLVGGASCLESDGRKREIKKGKRRKARRWRRKERMHKSVRGFRGGAVGVLIVEAGEAKEATSVMEERSYAVPNKQSGRLEVTTGLGLGKRGGGLRKSPPWTG